MTGPRVDAIGDRYDVVVVGGGPAGLTAGVTAARAGASVAVLDARRLGGRSAVDRVGDADAIVFNRGPHAFYQEGAAASILMSLGIRPTGGTAPVRGSWLYHDDGEFVVMPTGPTALVRTQALSIASKVRAGALLAGIGRIDAAALSGRTAAEWIDERSGGSASAAAVLAAIVRVATYASDLDTLSADVAVSQVALAVKSGVRYLDGGFQQIVDRLDAAGRSAGMTVRTATPVTSIRQTGTGWIVEADGRRIEAGSIVLAAGGPDTARRLLGGDPGWGTLGPDVTAACLELAVRGRAVPALRARARFTAVPVDALPARRPGASGHPGRPRHAVRLDLERRRPSGSHHAGAPGGHLGRRRRRGTLPPPDGRRSCPGDGRPRGTDRQTARHGPEPGGCLRRRRLGRPDRSPVRRVDRERGRCRSPGRDPRPDPRRRGDVAMTSQGADRPRAEPSSGTDPSGRGGAFFEAERPRLTGLAYRMLGSVADAEDVVSEAWMRFDAADRSVIESPAAWLTTVTSRLAIDRLRAQQRRREDYVGPWLPEPILTHAGASTDRVAPSPLPDPGERVEMAESLTLGFLVVLDRLGPVERAVFLLHDVFGEPFAEISRMVGRSEENCRQIATRARRRVREERSSAREADAEVLIDLVSALAGGDEAEVIRLLAPDVVLTSDGGPNRRAARRPVVGSERVARFMSNVAGRIPSDAAVGIEEVNASPAFVMRSSTINMVLSVERGDDGRIGSIRMVLNPDKLAGVTGLDAPTVV